MSKEPAAAYAIREMIEFFKPYCDERSTLDLLSDMAGDKRLWPRGHDIFDQIRSKRSKPEHKDNQLRSHQYAFEEICAKALYNFSRSPAPFDTDSPFWVIPRAVEFATFLGIEDMTRLTHLLRPGSHTPKDVKPASDNPNKSP